jgi:predicted RNA binding protein YcfA (HicA-like mRNA interferase family)
MPKIGPVSWQSLARVLEAEGWTRNRQNGSHIAYTKPGCIRPIIIPKHDSLSIGVIMSNLRTAGLSRERFLELLNQHG